MKDYLLIKTIGDLREYLEELNTSLVTFDVETLNLDIFSQILGIQLYDGTLPPCFISVQSPIFNGIELDEIRDIFNEFNFKNWFIGGHNIKFDLCVLKAHGFEELPEVYYDTLLAVHTYDPDRRKKLETRVKEDLGYAKASFEEIVGKKWDRIDWMKDTRHTVDKKTKLSVKPIITLQMLAEYGCADVYYTLKLWEYYLPILKKENLLDVLFKLEIPLIKVLVDMKYYGIKIDCDVLEEMGERLVDKMTTLEALIYEEAGREFNINSSKQKAEILFKEMRLPVVKRSEKTNEPSSDGAVLEVLAEQGHAIAKYIDERSGLSKLYTGYAQAIPKLVYADKRLRGDFNSAGTTTGRFCVSEDTLITTDKGLLRIGDIVPKEEGSIKLDESIKVLTHLGNYKEVTHAINKGEEEMFLVELEDGKSIECTLNHRFLNSETNVWLSLKDILSLPTESTKIKTYGD